MTSSAPSSCEQVGHRALQLLGTLALLCVATRLLSLVRLRCRGRGRRPGLPEGAERRGLGDPPREERPGDGTRSSRSPQPPPPPSPRRPALPRSRTRGRREPPSSPKRPSEGPGPAPVVPGKAVRTRSRSTSAKEEEDDEEEEAATGRQLLLLLRARSPGAASTASREPARAPQVEVLYDARRLRCCLVDSEGRARAAAL
ncbi:hypothetical protein JRQ81_004645 [Phrynocephalus forsythii]|uniref:Uncharacterized protein n=1 Tax=Phrynocephalus forsythii TaxID=171643 RepID=A0A9Q0XFI6_9SAUR|nr:hypothetical protein JRQ81_004645 [Phrynocephalus forsythii]